MVSQGHLRLQLFEVNEERVKLIETDTQFFHHSLAKFILQCKSAQPDIQMAVSFLSTKVQNPDVDDHQN